MMMHKPHLNTAVPVVAEGPQGDFPECDIVHKYLKIKGMDIVIGFAYVMCNIGIKGENLHRLAKIDALRHGGRRYIVMTADWNITPGEWQRNGILENMGLAIITALS